MKPFTLIDNVREVTERGSIVPYPKRSLWATDCHVIQEIGDEEHKAMRTFGKCRRNIVMSMLGIGGEWENNYETQMIFDVGHQFEAQWQKYFMKAGIWRGSNVKWFSNEYKISGEYDAVVEIEGEPILVEFKTGTGGFKYREVIGNGIISEDYIGQVGLYLWSGQDVFLNGAKLIFWVGSDRKINIREFEIDRDEDWNLYFDGAKTRLNVMDILESLEETRRMFDEKIIPARGYYKKWSDELFAALVAEGLEYPNKKKRSDWRCDYCYHANYCNQLPEGELTLKEYHKIFPEEE